MGAKKGKWWGKKSASDGVEKCQVMKAKRARGGSKKRQVMGAKKARGGKLYLRRLHAHFFASLLTPGALAGVMSIMQKF